MAKKSRKKNLFTFTDKNNAAKIKKSEEVRKEKRSEKFITKRFLINKNENTNEDMNEDMHENTSVNGNINKIEILNSILVKTFYLFYFVFLF